jgi:hypothetical protein
LKTRKKVLRKIKIKIKRLNSTNEANPFPLKGEQKLLKNQTKALDEKLFLPA